MKIQTSNTILYCSQWDKTVEFYTIGLNLPVLPVKEWFMELQLTDSARLSIAHADHTSIKSGGGKGLTISLQTDDVEIAYTCFQGKGLHPKPLHRVWDSKAFYLFDPEGNRIEFWS
jgi:catechol-2,3-dioxygenase